MRLLNYFPLIGTLLFLSCFYFITNQITKPRDYIYKLCDLELNLHSGDKLDLKSLKGKYIILHLFASWCESCKQDLPELEKLKKENNAILIGIAMNDKNCKKTLAYDYLAIDKNLSVYRLVKNQKIPETLIINQDGIVVYHHSGPLKSKK